MVFGWDTGLPGERSLFLFGFVCILLTIALLPKYIQIKTQIDAFALETQKESNKDNTLIEAEQEVTKTREVLAQLKSSKVSITASEAIDEIQKHAPAEIIFKNFATELSNGVVVKIQAQGIAPTREALSRLKIAIESSEIFDKAEVPISDLARDINVPFSITITLVPRT